MRALGEEENRPPHMELAWALEVSSDTGVDPSIEEA